MQPTFGIINKGWYKVRFCPEKKKKERNVQDLRNSFQISRKLEISNAMNSKGKFRNLRKIIDQLWVFLCVLVTFSRAECLFLFRHVSLCWCLHVLEIVTTIDTEYI